MLYKGYEIESVCSYNTNPAFEFEHGEAYHDIETCLKEHPGRKIIGGYAIPGIKDIDMPDFFYYLSDAMKVIDGYIEGNSSDIEVTGIRYATGTEPDIYPIITIGNPEKRNLKRGDEFELSGYEWTMISTNEAKCNKLWGWLGHSKAKLDQGTITWLEGLAVKIGLKFRKTNHSSL